MTGEKALTKQQCSICGSPDHTHLHCYGMQAQGAISSNRMTSERAGLVLRLQEWSRNCLIDGFKMDRGEPTLQSLLKEAAMVLMRSGDSPAVETSALHMDLQRRGRDTTLEMASLRLLGAIEALGQFTPGKITYFEASPTKDAEAHKRWVELNDAGKLVREVLQHRKDSESSEETANEGRPLTHAEAAVVEAFSDELTTIYRCKCGSMPGTSVRGQMYCTNCGNYRADKPGSQVKAPDDEDSYIHGPGTFPHSDGCRCERCSPPNGKADSGKP